MKSQLNVKTEVGDFVKCMLPSLPVAVRATVEMPELDGLVKLYFRIGFSNKDILSFSTYNKKKKY